MERTLAADAPKLIDREILLKGWVKTRRDHGKLIFLDLRDRSGIIQVVINQSVSEEAYKIATDIRSEYVVAIMGVIHKRPKHLVNQKIKTGAVEVEAKNIEIVSRAQTLPFDMETETLHLELPTLLDNRSLTLRHQKVQEVFQVQAKVVEGFRIAAENLGCTEIIVPTIAASSTEGGSEVFTVDYYQHKTFLTQSPQLYKQMLVPVFERVWTIAHAYRAEPSVTTYHLSETTQMDCELGFVSFGELLDALEGVAVSMLKHVEEHCEDILESHGVEKIAYAKIPRLTLREAQDIIYKEFGRDVRSEKDLARQDEVDICQWALKNHGSDLVTITHFPTEKRAFYTMPDPKNPQYSLSYDLLFKGVEILSGSQRIHEYDALVAALKDRGMDPKNFGMYLMAFKYGMPPEGGFSFGLERITMKLLQLSNIREATLYPRDMERVDERFSLQESNKKTDRKE